MQLLSCWFVFSGNVKRNTVASQIEISLLLPLGSELLEIILVLPWFSHNVDYPHVVPSLYIFSSLAEHKRRYSEECFNCYFCIVNVKGVKNNTENWLSLYMIFFFFFLRLTMTLGWINNIWIWAMFQIKTCFKHKNFNTRQFRWKNYLLYLYSMEEHVWTCKVESPVHIPQLSLG